MENTPALYSSDDERSLSDDELSCDSQDEQLTSPRIKVTTIEDPILLLDNENLNMIVIDGTSVEFHYRYVKNRIVTTEGRYLDFTGDGKEAMIKKLCDFLTEFKRHINSGHYLRKYLDDLAVAASSVVDFENHIQLLVDIGFHVPDNTGYQSADRRDRFADSNVIELMKEMIPICMSEDLLLRKVMTFPWYMAASRRSVTLAHLSKAGLPPEFAKFVYTIAKTSPQLAFALSPTTIHDISFLTAEVAPIFTCDPFVIDKTDLLSSYQSVVTEEAKVTYMTNGLGLLQNNKAVSEKRIRDITDKFKIGGYFPWTHPQRANTGVALCGGFTSAVLLVEEQWQVIRKKGTDLDFFIYGPTEMDRKTMLFFLLRHFRKLNDVRIKEVEKKEGKHEEVGIGRSRSIFRVTGLGEDVQVICPYASSPLGVLMNFDMSFIQVGYHEVVNGDKSEGKFFCSSGYSFFTPRSESLLTRSMIRVNRLVKVMRKGFLPVSDVRGHLLCPGDIFFSSVFRIDMEENFNKDAQFMAYKDFRKQKLDAGMTPTEIERKYGDQILLGRCRPGSIKAADRKLIEERHHYWIDHTDLIEDCTTYSVKIYDSRSPFERFELYNDVASINGACVPHSGGNYLTSHYTSFRPPMHAWEDITKNLDELEKTFEMKDTENLSNAFDYYTSGINSTLPIIEDGKTEHTEFRGLFLRNVKIVCANPTDKINIGYENGKGQISKKAEKIVDTEKYYNEKWGTNTCYRTIEGVFVFQERRPEREVKEEIAQRREKFQIRAEKLRATRIYLAKEKLAKASDRKIDEIADDEVATVDVQKNPYDEPTPGMLKTMEYRNALRVPELHEYLEEITDIRCIDISEVPKMMRCFSLGEDYVNGNNKVKRSHGMVRVQAPVSLRHLNVFDVDDLLLSKATVDSFPDRRYNVCLSVANFDRWIIEDHPHDTVAIESWRQTDCRNVTLDYLKWAHKQEVLKHNTIATVDNFCVFLATAFTSDEFKDVLKTALCHKPHAHPDLLGEMPVIELSRIYVCMHNKKN